MPEPVQADENPIRPSGLGQRVDEVWEKLVDRLCLARVRRETAQTAVSGSTIGDVGRGEY